MFVMILAVTLEWVAATEVIDVYVFYVRRAFANLQTDMTRPFRRRNWIYQLSIDQPSCPNSLKPTLLLGRFGNWPALVRCLQDCM